ncbi:MAG: nitroreductase [Quisquiliibacterium sp.]
MIGSERASEPGPAETLERLLASRHSCRAFLPEAVPRATIEKILAIAQRTASWCNSQPWQLTIASGDALHRYRKALDRQVSNARPGPDFQFPGEYRGVYQQRRRECGFQLYEAVGVERGDRAAGERQRMENFRFFGAPHVAIVTSDAPLGVYGAVDCGAYVTNFMLAAQAFGVASIAQAALAAYPDCAREQLGIGPDRLMVCGISFGFEDEAHAANRFRTSRAAIEDAVTWLE